MAAAEHLVHAMGTTAHIAVVAPGGEAAETLADAAVRRLWNLERRWSRFLPTSEISLLNGAAGLPVPVSADTHLLVTRAIEACHRTRGRFDPTVLPSLLAAGYDRDFRAVAADPREPSPPTPAPGGHGIDVTAHTVTLPEGVGFDPGGIGKGLAADLIVDLVTVAGATGACINIGGDLRAVGTADGGSDWQVTIDDPLGRVPALGTLGLRNGAIVSTWRTRRTWGTGDRRRHHVIDPRDGTSVDGGLAGVCVLADDAWWAEAVATDIFVAGATDAPGVVHHHGVSALLVRDDGARRGFGRLADLAGTAATSP